MKYILIALLFTISLSIELQAQQIDIQGHRGARGILPENSILGFLAALDSGATTIEIDVVVSKDGLIVVSHEPYMNHDICLDRDGNSINKSEEKEHNIYQYNYDEIKKFDCGTIGNLDFPEQQKLKVSKPLLSEVIKTVEKHIKNYTFFEVDYNIDIKSGRSTDNINHPPTKEFCDLIYELIDAYLPWERVNVQSFDFRVLKYWHQQYPGVRLAVLIANIKSIDTNLANLGFKPEIYSPHFRLLNKRKVRNLHKRGLKVIPWTVNDVKQMKKIMGWGVDGIITDYPHLANTILKEKAESM